MSAGSDSLHLLKGEKKASENLLHVQLRQQEAAFFFPQHLVSFVLLVLEQKMSESILLSKTEYVLRVTCPSPGALRPTSMFHTYILYHMTRGRQIFSVLPSQSPSVEKQFLSRRWRKRAGWTSRLHRTCNGSETFANFCETGQWHVWLANDESQKR